MYARVLDRLSAEGLEPNVSVKLTQLGQDISEAVLRASLARVLEKARALGAFVRFDMESSQHTTRTLDTFAELWDQGWRDIGAQVIRTSLDIAQGKTVDKKIVMPTFVVDKAAMEKIDGGSTEGTTEGLVSDVKRAIGGCQ